MAFFKKNKILLFIGILLAIMPFFWLKPGEMDLGGDGGRLYFYDPVNLIKNLALYHISPFGIGTVEAKFFYLPFVTMLAGLKQVIDSSYILISIYNALKVIVGFFAVYAIVKELIGKTNNSSFSTELTSILAGLFYLSTPAMIENYVKAIPSHDQVFLNPLMFYLILRFFLTGAMRFAWVALIVSFLFSHSFSYAAAPPFFAFYPLAFFFIFLYCKFIRKVKIPWKKLLMGSLLFLGIHAFHLVPESLDLFTLGSNTNTRVFNAADAKDQVSYFYGVLHIPKTSFYFFSYSLTKLLGVFSIIIPLVAILGLILNQKKEKTMLLTTLFFLITFFLVAGKVTMIGIKFYEWLFYIPGFSMFRNFYGQWQFVFYFFYALLFGLAIFSILQKIKSNFFSNIIFLTLATYFVISSWQFINGSLVNPFREGAKNVKAAIVMDPQYEEALTFIRQLSDDGKILVLPFTDSYVQVIHGLNDDGTYVGHSTIGQLTGKNDFAGYQDMPPYSSKFWDLSKEKKYESIKKILGFLNIHYIFYNSDTRIYDDTFPGGPYSPNYVRKYMPATQNEYKDYIKAVAGQKIFERGFYNIYKINDEAYLPHFYIPNKIFVYEDDPSLDIYSKASAFFKEDIDKKSLFIESQTCKILFAENLCSDKVIIMENNLPTIQFEKLNPTKYRVKVSNSTKPYVLTFSEAFHKNWKVYITDQKSEKTELSEKTHFIGNGYANAWLISPQDVGDKGNYQFVVEMTRQRFFYFSLGISTLSFFILLLWMSKAFLNQKKYISATIKN